MDIITVVLGADTKKDRTKDSVKLIKYTYSNYKMYNVREKIEEQFNNWRDINTDRIQIIKGKGDTMNLKLGDISVYLLPLQDTKIDTLECEFNTITVVEAPVEEKTKIGTMVVKLDGKIIDTIDIINTNKIEKKTWLDYLKTLVKKIYLCLN